MAANRDDARDRLILAMSDALSQLIDASRLQIPGSVAQTHRENIAGYQKELLEQAPQLHGPPEKAV
jgi:hypothetical protein